VAESRLALRRLHWLPEEVGVAAGAEEGAEAAGSEGDGAAFAGALEAAAGAEEL